MLTIPESSAEHYLGQQRITAKVLEAATSIWGSRPPRDFDMWFAANVDRLVELVTVGQRAAVDASAGYVDDAIEEFGLDTEQLAEVEPSSLVDIASDGRALDSLLYGSVITAKGYIGQNDTSGGALGAVTESAWRAGLYALQLRVQTQVADASRVATGLHITSHTRMGYVRMLNPPSCSRCAVLAGRFYRFSAGFLRHPGCDCRHVPSTEEIADDVLVDPAEYFQSLSPELQDKTFTVAGAQAIRDGADMGQVVNARRGANGLSTAGRIERRNVYGQQLVTTSEGTTKRGVAGKVIRNRGRNPDTTPRLMPEDIYEIVGGDRDETLRMLQLNGYVLDRTGPRSGAGSRTGLVPRPVVDLDRLPDGAAAGPVNSGRHRTDDFEPAGSITGYDGPIASDIVSKSAKTFLRDSELSLPYGNSGWQGEADIVEVRPRETRLERNVWRAEQKIVETTAILDAIRARSPRLGRGELNTNNKRAAYEAQLLGQVDVVDGKLSRARSEASITSLRVERLRLEQEIADIKVERNATLDLLGAEEVVARAKAGKVGPRDSEVVSPVTEYSGQVDVNGNQLPSIALERHLDTVLAAGRTMQDDLRRAFDADPVLTRIRAEQAAAAEVLSQAERAYFGLGEERSKKHPLFKALSTAKSSFFAFEREVARRESAVIRAALTEVREFGGFEMPARLGTAGEARDETSPGSGRIVRELREAESFYPKAWLERAADRGELVLFQTDRAYFLERGAGDSDMLAAPNLEATQTANQHYDGAYDGNEIEIMVHEVGHRMERAVPGLTELEFALVRRRAMTDGVLEDTVEFSPNEFSLEDQWTNVYTGKVYRNGVTPESQSAHEAFQTGTQDLFGRGSQRFGDDELEAFMLGTLALL